ncbi:MAG: peptide chain release factor N(5)-glutamine methyltransferase [Solirubrobacterales bacterium]
MLGAVASVGDALGLATATFEAANVDLPQLDAELLLAEVLAVGRAELHADPGRELEQSQSEAFERLVQRRRSREPLAYILERAHFRNLELHVDQRVLIPRPETELLVETALDGQRVLDIGTGSGAIALAIARERVGVRVTGIDNSPGAIEVSRANAAALGVEVELMIADLIVGGPYDLIVSNPPYVRDGEWAGLQPEITLYEPQEALLAGSDGLDVIRDLVPAAAAVLTRGGTLAVEIGQGQSREVESLFERAGLRGLKTPRDLAGMPRVVTGRRRP